MGECSEIQWHGIGTCSNPGPLSHTTPPALPCRQALAVPNVWFVTYSDLIRWMEAPVPASQMEQWLKCAPVNFAAEGGQAPGGEMYAQRMLWG